MKYLFALISFLVITACSHVGAYPSYPTRLHIEKIHRSVYIDSEFNDDDQELIEQAIDEWDYSTNHMVDYEFVGKIDLKDYYSLNENDIFIYKTDHQDLFIKNLDDGRKDGLITIGYCRIYKQKATKLYIVYDKIYTYSDLKAVVIHELGHSIGLLHTNDENSVMYYNEGKATGYITNVDLVNFCNLYYCDPKDMHTYVSSR